MKTIDLNIERTLAEEKIEGDSFDFTAKYFAVYELRNIAERQPEIINEKTLWILEQLFQHPQFAKQRQGFFLFRETANTLSALLRFCGNIRMAERTLTVFKRILTTVSSHAHRAAAEALGALPVSICRPALPDMKKGTIFRASIQDIIGKTGIKSPGAPMFFGRSLVIPCRKTKRLLVFKLARCTDTPDSLATEVMWMDYLRGAGSGISHRFDVPETIHIGNFPVFSLTSMPVNTAEKLHPKKYAIAFSAHPEYFTYPNDPGSAGHVSGHDFKEILFRNAWLSGKFASQGIIHAALIPLFHNRVQQGRRRDQGLYEWFRAGRLDQWLHSCDYPNLGPTGLRDFEHFSAFNENGLSLYRLIGGQLLSFFLLAGSYFRNKNKEQRGFDKNGKPVDVRFLFDQKLLDEIVSGVFHSYYNGFTGTVYADNPPVDTARLTSRMIEEMGVDRHMEEILRVADQHGMTDIEFRSFLSQRGFSDHQIDGFVRGEKEIIIYSGPHLGGFNEPISIPELIEAVAAMSGLCIGGKFWRQQFKRSMCAWNNSS